MKKTMTALTTAALLATSISTASAATTVQINGAPLETDQAPIILEGRTLVPMRVIFEALGCEVEWQDDTQTVFAEKGLDHFSLTINDRLFYINGESTVLDVAPQIVAGRTMVPLRAVSEALDAHVEWYDATKTVAITTSDNNVHELTTGKIASDENGLSIDVQYPILAGNSVQVKQVNRFMHGSAVETVNAFTADLEGQDTALYPAELNTRYAVTLSAGPYLSILSQDVTYTGGAHPMTFKRGAVYNVSAGAQLSLEDILNLSKQDAERLIYDAFNMAIQANPDQYYEQEMALKGLEAALQEDSYTYYLAKDGLHIVLPLYTIAPYAAGFSEMTISYDTPEIFRINVPHELSDQEIIAYFEKNILADAAETDYTITLGNDCVIDGIDAKEVTISSVKNPTAPYIGQYALSDDFQLYEWNTTVGHFTLIAE